MLLDELEKEVKTNLAYWVQLNGLQAQFGDQAGILKMKTVDLPEIQESLAAEAEMLKLQKYKEFIDTMKYSSIHELKKYSEVVN